MVRQSSMPFFSPFFTVIIYRNRRPKKSAAFLYFRILYPILLHLTRGFEGKNPLKISPHCYLTAAPTAAHMLSLIHIFQTLIGLVDRHGALLKVKVRRGQGQQLPLPDTCLLYTSSLAGHKGK